MVSVNTAAITANNGDANDVTEVKTAVTTLSDNDSTLATAVTAIEDDYLTRAGVFYQKSGLRPAYVSASTFTVTRGQAIDNNQSRFMQTTGTKTIDMTTLGAINGIAQTANLTGTASSAGTAVTGVGTLFTSEFQVGDVMHGVTNAEGRRVVTITDNLNIVIESAYSVALSAESIRNGGEAKNTWYHLYMIDDGTTPGFILSTRDVSGGDTLPAAHLPSGYTDTFQHKLSIRNDASQDIIEFFCGTDFVNDGHLIYNYRITSNAVLTNGTATSATDVDCSSLVPPTSRLVDFRAFARNESTTPRTYNLKEKSGNWQFDGEALDSDLGSETSLVIIPNAKLDTSQTLQYNFDTAPTLGLTLGVKSYKVTEVI